MAAAANIVLADAQGTPVNHTFIPLQQDANGVWWFEDQSPASPIGYNRISVQMTRPQNPAAGAKSGNERMIRVKLGLHTPILETLANNSAGIVPPPQVAYVCRAIVEMLLPERSTLQNRKDLRKYTQFLCADAQVVAMVESLVSIY